MHIQTPTNPQNSKIEDYLSESDYLDNKPHDHHQNFSECPKKLDLTVTLITYNEEKHIEKVLKSVTFASEIILVDSGSNDKTLEIAKKYGAKIVHQPFLGYGQQKNLAQSLATNDWILNLDGDEILSPSAGPLIQAAMRYANQTYASKDQKKQKIGGFYLLRKNYFRDRWIRFGGWYPDKVVRLIKKGEGEWTTPFVHEKLKSTQRIAPLTEVKIEHFGFSGLEDQVLTNLHFAKLGAKDLYEKKIKFSILKLYLKPFSKFLHLYFLKGGFLDGIYGFVICINASYSLFLKYFFLWELEQSKKTQSSKKSESIE